MDQGRWFQGVAGFLDGESRRGELSKFVVDKGEQFGGGVVVTFLGSLNQTGHVGHRSLDHTPLNNPSRVAKTESDQ